MEEAIAKIEGFREDAKKNNFERIIDYIITRCKESESLAKDILQEHKTWERCQKYILDQAREFLHSKNGCVEDQTVYEWAEDYFHLDDKEQIEKAEREAKERDAKIEANRAKFEAERQKTEEQRKAEREAAEMKKGQVEGQMDLFSMLGESNE